MEYWHGVKSLPGDWANHRWHSATQGFIDKPETIWSWMKNETSIRKFHNVYFRTTNQGKTTP